MHRPLPGIGVEPVKNKYERARDHAARELLILLNTPADKQAQARRVADALSYLTSVLYDLPLPQHQKDETVPPPEEPDLVAQIRATVDQDVTDPEDWYKLILKVRDLVGVTR